MNSISIAFAIIHNLSLLIWLQVLAVVDLHVNAIASYFLKHYLHLRESLGYSHDNVRFPG